MKQYIDFVKPIISTVANSVIKCHHLFFYQWNSYLFQMSFYYHISHAIHSPFSVQGIVLNKHEQRRSLLLSMSLGRIYVQKNRGKLKLKLDVFSPNNALSFSIMENHEVSFGFICGLRNCRHMYLEWKKIENLLRKGLTKSVLTLDEPHTSVRRGFWA